MCLPDIIAAGPVALRKESVDRNPMAARTSSRWSVALRKESVDRNVAYLATSARLTVALRKESVDRNIADYAKPEWLRVALRKESVDRNRPGVPIPGPGGRSLSARRAWIEISFSWAASWPMAVALRKESVDRNTTTWSTKSIT